MNSGQHPCGHLPADEGPAPGADGPLLLLDHPAAADDEGPQRGAEGPLLLPDPQLLLMMKAPSLELKALRLLLLEQQRVGDQI